MDYQYDAETVALAGARLAAFKGMPSEPTRASLMSEHAMALLGMEGELLLTRLCPWLGSPRIEPAAPGKPRCDFRRFGGCIDVKATPYPNGTLLVPPHIRHHCDIYVLAAGHRIGGWCRGDKLRMTNHAANGATLREPWLTGWLEPAKSLAVVIAQLDDVRDEAQEVFGDMVERQATLW